MPRRHTPTPTSFNGTPSHDHCRQLVLQSASTKQAVRSASWQQRQYCTVDVSCTMDMFSLQAPKAHSTLGCCSYPATLLAKSGPVCGCL
jgi:hypothetical protein